MSKTRFAFGLTVLLATTGWLLVRPGPPMAQAHTLQSHIFTEDDAAHRYATNQPRHWRAMLNRK